MSRDSDSIRGPAAGRSFARFDVAIAVAVAVCFAASTAVGHWGLHQLDDATSDIAFNAAPSIEHLAAARAEMRALEFELREYVRQAAAGHVLPREAIDSQRVHVRTAVEAYRALPVFPGERDLWAGVAAELDGLDAMIDRTLTSARAGDRAAMETASAGLKEQFGRVAAGIHRSMDFDARHAHDLALRVARVTSWTTWTAEVLDFLALGLAIALGVALVRAARAHARLVEERNALLRERAAELEMFAGRVAHDILGPLTTVGLALETRVTSEGTAAAIAAPARRSLQRVKTIVTGLLEFARSGGRPDALAATDTRSVIEDLLRDLEPSAAEAGVAITLGPAEHGAVACSAGVLTSLVSNLVRNAIKYIGDGPERRIAVRVIDRGPAIRVEVEDTGPGLPPELEARLFEPYARGRGNKQPGIGLGLSTVKRLAQAHGGSIGFRSNPGAGSLFWFELPRATVPREAGVIA